MWDSAEHPEIQQGGLWYAREVRNFKKLDSPPTPGVAVAACFTTIAVNVPEYLSFLLRHVRNHANAKIIRHVLPAGDRFEASIDSAYQLARSAWHGVDSLPEMTAVVNASGLGARRLCKDNTMYPVRGQTVLVRGEAKYIRTRHGADKAGKDCISYVIPRPGSGTTVLGGVNEPGKWSEEPDEETVQAILQRCRALAPELLTARDGQDFDVLSVQVGLRPAREGGCRVEGEVFHINDSSTPVTVVHAYGHGGAGFQNSYGVARRVSRLLDPRCEHPVRL